MLRVKESRRRRPAQQIKASNAEHGSINVILAPPPPLNISVKDTKQPKNNRITASHLTIQLRVFTHTNYKRNNAMAFSKYLFSIRRKLYEKHTKSNDFVALRGALRHNLRVRFYA
jgi:hypothetical protein